MPSMLVLWLARHTPPTANNTQRHSEWVSSVLRPHQHSIGYMGDGFYRSKERPNQQYQSTEGDATKEKENNENN